MEDSKETRAEDATFVNVNVIISYIVNMQGYQV